MARPRDIDRTNVKNLVLEKSKKMFVHEGYDNITMRRIAKEIGYTPGTIYLYFKNKEEILYELHNEGFKLLYQYKNSTKVSSKMSAVERLIEGGKSYIDFALENPEYYEVMFNMPEPRDYLKKLKAIKKSNEEPDADYAMKSYDFLKQRIQEFQNEGYLKGVDTDTAAFLFWSTVHGIASLTIRQRGPFSNGTTRDTAKNAIDLFMKIVAV
jgi:AcrR family transcriptional regulator